MKSFCFKTLREQQKLNHFPGTFEIGHKDKLWKNFNRLRLKYGKEQFGFIPISYILPRQAKTLRQAWEKNDKEKWIVKPVLFLILLLQIMTSNLRFFFLINSQHHIEELEFVLYQNGVKYQRKYL